MKDIVTDFSQFAALRNSENVDSPETLKRVADQFETLFLQSLLKSMRDASPGDPIFGKGSDNGMYQSLFDSQLAADLSQGSGFGLSELLVRQLGGAEAATEPNVEKPPLELTPAQFTRKLWPYASRAASELGTTPKAIVAQAALETGWGQHAPKHADGTDSHNYFGIKAGADWDGESIARSTLEFRDGVAQRETHRFRSYPSLSAAFADYADLIGNNPRYTGALNQADDVAAFARGLVDGGYATDPRYAEKLEAVTHSSHFEDAIRRLDSGGLRASDMTMANQRTR